MKNEGLESKFAREPARGERANLTGIYPQYRAAALLLLDTLHKGQFEEARLADPKAGRVDDWQVLTAGRLDAYQFKWSRYAGTVTLNGLLNGKKSEESVFRALASGWKNRKAAFEERKVVVHLAMNSVASKSAQAAVTKTCGNDLEDRHLAAFMEDSWVRVHAGEISIPADGQPWHDTWAEIRKSTGLESSEFEDFVRSCVLHFPFRTDFTAGLSEREKYAWDSAVSEMTKGLLSLPSTSPVIALNRQDLLKLFGFREEHLPTFSHEFRLEDYVHEPLKEAADRLDEIIDQVHRGYICLKGTPGSGKSTTLTLVFRKRRERVVRYYAYTPQGQNQTRGESQNFLIHLVAELSRLGIQHDGKVPHKGDRHLLLERFRNQLEKLAREFSETGKKTLILVDGLDHIIREQHPEKSLLEDLPAPSEIPAGVVFVLGTQTTDFLDAGIRQSLRREGRTIAMVALSLLEIERVLLSTGILSRLSEIQRRKIVSLSGRHPLALRYLVRKLENCVTSADINEALDGQFPFDDNIEHYYRNLWDQIEKSSYELTRIFSLIARLRKPATYEWLLSWVDPKSIDEIRRKFSHYFEKSSGRLQFFHNSFRIFILELTSEDEDGIFDATANRCFHVDLAKHCANSERDSSWRTEQFFHLAESGQNAEALALARPKWFRDQFLAMRPKDEIFADLRKAFELASAESCGLSAGRLVLAESELHSRFEALDFDRVTMLSLLIRGKEASRALGWIRSESELKVAPDDALDLVGALQDTGESAEAEKLFNLIETSSPLAAKSLTNGIRSQRKFLVKWAEVAVDFIPVEEILVVIRRFEFASISSWNGGQEIPTPVDQDSERKVTVAHLAIHFETLGKADLSGRLTGEFEWGEVPMDYRLEYLLACFENGGEHVEEIIHLTSQSPDHYKLRIAELLARRGHEAEVREIFEQIEIPHLSYGAIMGQEAEKEKRARAWLRVAFYLGERRLNATAEIQTSASFETSKGALAAAHQLIADLHALAWRSKTVSPGVVFRRIEKVFELLHLRYSDRGFDVDISYEKPRIMEALVDACTDLGLNALTILCRSLNRQWTQSAILRYWNNSLMREVLVNLCHAGVEKKWVGDWLTVVDGQVEDSSAVGTRVSEYVAQSKAWIVAGEPVKALESARLGLQMSLGIGYHKDYQLSGWIEYLDRVWRDAGSPSENFVSQIAKTIVALDGEIHGAATADAAILLVQKVFRADPPAGLKLWEYFTENGAVSFPGALKSVIQIVVDNEEDPTVAAELVGELFIPLADEPDAVFLADILRKVFRTHGNKAAQNLAETYATRVDTVSVDTDRNTWWLGLRHACGALGLCLPRRQSPVNETRGEYNRDRTDETIALIYEAKVPFLEMVRQKRSHERNSADITQSPHIDWEVVGTVMAHGMSSREIEIFLKLFRKDSYLGGRVGRSLIKRVEELGMNSRLWTFGENLLEQLDEKRNGSFVTERELAPVFSILLSADPQAGRERLLGYLTHHQWLGPFFLPAVRDGLLPNREERGVFDTELAGHLSILLNGSEGDAPEPQLDFYAQPQLTGSQALIHLIFSLLDHPSRIVHHAARRVFTKLGRSGSADWLLELKTTFGGERVTACVFGLLAEFSSEELRPHATILESSLPKLFEIGDIEARGSILLIASKLGFSMPQSRSTASPLAGSYLTLPRVDFDRLPHPLKLIYDLISCTSRVTEIPDSNLFAEAERILKPLLASRADILAIKEYKNLSWTLAQADLRYFFTDPDKVIGLKVGFQLLAELHSKLVIPDGAIPEIRRLFSQQEYSFVRVEPTSRPEIFTRKDSAWEEKTWSADWLHAPPAELFRHAPVLEDGWVVIAYLHKFRFHTDHLPVEAHLGLLRRGSEAGNHPLHYSSHFQEEDQPREYGEYYGWQREEDDDELFLLGGQTKDLPCPPWLALQPELARRMGWVADRSGMFSWKDGTGNRVAESRWWSDGPADSSDSNGNRYTATGWICALSPSAWERLNQISELYFGATRERFHSK